MVSSRRTQEILSDDCHVRQARSGRGSHMKSTTCRFVLLPMEISLSRYALSQRETIDHAYR
eukprot:10173649-Prorocentrum_lima.AAC.1